MIGRQEAGFNRLRSFIGPLLMGGGGGGGDSIFLRELPEMVVAMVFESEGMSVVEESRVDFLETAAEGEPERDSCGVAYGFGAEAKFLKEGSDIRGAFQGKRRMTMHLELGKETEKDRYAKMIAKDQISAGCGS